jgi:hypothetical protein
MITRTHFLLLLITLALFAASTRASAPSYLYKTKLVQAAPGRLLDLIEFTESVAH